MKKSLEFILKSHQKEFNNVSPFDLNAENITVLDFSKKNEKLSTIDFTNEQSFCEYIDNELTHQGAIAGIGGYGEDRILYSRSSVFDGEEARSVHLGIDIWAPARTPIFSPLDGKVHSFQVNPSSGDYGPTIILEHELDDLNFFTLYGHLNTASLDGLSKNQQIKGGQQFAEFGKYEENVHWPPHLHFQIIEDMGGREGDFPGVAAPSESQSFLANCPDPNLILKSRHLNPSR